jgi:ribonuclease HI
MKFKGERVWIRADAAGKPELDSVGRAEMKYRESDSKSYRPFAGNLEPDGDGGEVKTFASASASPSTSTKAGTSVKRDAKALELWTDGACSGNPGPMGIGIVALDGGKRKEHGEYLGIGTNNIAELTAIDRALDLAGAEAETRHVRVYTDSAYSIGVLSKGWKAKANQELIARMRKRLAKLPDIEFVKVSGHAGVPENERCDELARRAISGR